MLLAMPVGQMDGSARPLCRISENTIVTDAGSTKRDVIRAIYRHLGAHLANVVPAHPIAGAEKGGPAPARADLYASQVVVTPLPENNAAARCPVREEMGGLRSGAPRDEPRRNTTGSRRGQPSALICWPSAGPIWLAAPNAEQLFSYAASGFRDFTRLPAAIPKCGATSASPIAIPCWRNWTPIPKGTGHCAPSWWQGDGLALNGLRCSQPARTVGPTNAWAVQLSPFRLQSPAAGLPRAPEIGSSMTEFIDLPPMRKAAGTACVCPAPGISTACCCCSAGRSDTWSRLLDSTIPG